MPRSRTKGKPAPKRLKGKALARAVRALREHWSTVARADRVGRAMVKNMTRAERLAVIAPRLGEKTRPENLSTDQQIAMLGALAAGEGQAFANHILMRRCLGTAT